MKTLIGATVTLVLIAITFGIIGSVGLSDAVYAAEINQLSCAMGLTKSCSPTDSASFSRSIINLSIAGFAAFFGMTALLLTLHARAVRQARN